MRLSSQADSSGAAPALASMACIAATCSSIGPHTTPGSKGGVLVPVASARYVRVVCIALAAFGCWVCQFGPSCCALCSRPWPSLPQQCKSISASACCTGSAYPCLAPFLTPHLGPLPGARDLLRRFDWGLHLFSASFTVRGNIVQRYCGLVCLPSQVLW